MELICKNMQFDFATTDEIAAEFGARIRAHRLAQNLQQSELAARAGVSEPEFVRIGLRRIYSRASWLLARVFRSAH